MEAMKSITKRFLSSLKMTLVIGSALFLASCGTGSNPQMGSLQIRLHDAPIDSADAVNVSIKQVEVNKDGTPDGWSVISTPDQTYNLLDLANGAYEVLGDTTLEAGTYQQIRLILNDTGNNLVVGDQTYDLKVPSGSQTGIKLNVNAEIRDGIQYVLLLDFDASRSVVHAGNAQGGNKYLLKPVIKATNQAVTGNIAGVASPAESKPVVYAIADSDTLATTVADTTDGSFMLVGLKEGTYTVSLDPRNDSYQTKDTTGVMVTVDETNDLGTIQLSQ